MRAIVVGYKVNFETRNPNFASEFVHKHLEARKGGGQHLPISWGNYWTHKSSKVQSYRYKLPFTFSLIGKEVRKMNLGTPINTIAPTSILNDIFSKMKSSASYCPDLYATNTRKILKFPLLFSCINELVITQPCVYIWTLAVVFSF